MAKNLKHGFTLIELVLYMSIFMILVSGVLYSSYYLQEVLLYNSVEYKVKEQIYRQLTLLQQHAKIAENVKISTSRIYMFKGGSMVSQELLNGKIFMRYTYIDKPEKVIEVYPYIKFTQFSFGPEDMQHSIESKSNIKINIERLDSRKKVQKLTEYILSPTVDFSPIP